MISARLFLYLTVAAFFVLLALSGVAAPVPTHAAFPGSNGRIAFRQVTHIATVNPDGSDLKPITVPAAGGADQFPTWSPDGTQIAFIRSDANSDVSIWVTDADGANARMVANEGPVELVRGLTWTADGKSIIYPGLPAVSLSEPSPQGSAVPSGGTPHLFDLWQVDIDTGGTTNITNTPDVSEEYPAVSPDGASIAYIGLTTPGGFGQYELYIMSSSGGAGTPLTNTKNTTEFAPNWSPDGTQIVFTGDGVQIIDAAGGSASTLAAGSYPAWSPDGTAIVYTNQTGTLETLAVAPGATPPQPGVKGFEADWGPGPQPVVFIHGFLGSRIQCGSAELWPNIPPGPNFDNMRLAADGVSNAPATCGATVGDILDTVLGGSIYKTAIDFLNSADPGNAFFYNWDWRSSPQNALSGLDAFIDGIRSSHNNQKVVIMAHSYGGLLARLYVSDSQRANKVARVLTVGTPAWGSPKAFFPLFAGIETPDLSALDALMDNDGLHEFAKNLLGAYFLYPTANYGSWLTIDPSVASSTEDLITKLGGNVPLYQQAQASHASTLDSFPSGVDFEAVVGTGVPTIAGVHILANDYLGIDYDNGDGTVPAKSAARGFPGAGNPNAAHTHYSCGVGHVPLPGDPQITDAVKGYLLSGAKITGLAAPCPAMGAQIRLFQLSNFVQSAASDTQAMSVQDAQEQGVVDYLDLPSEKFVITGQDFPQIQLPQARFLEVTPIMDSIKGVTRLYGPLSGAVTISSDGGVVSVVQGGEDLTPEGDANCDHIVDPMDALDTILFSAHLGTLACLNNADPNCDGAVDARDAVADLAAFADLSTVPPEDCATPGT